MQQHLSLGLLTTHLIQVRNWTVSTGPSVFTALENVRSELTNRRSQTSDQRIFQPLHRVTRKMTYNLFLQISHNVT
jgi:hypothetical protein